jgi:hypothetical protein
MEKVSKIVVERLKAGVPVTSHPDADVLTAFAEQSLPQAERSLVLGHLALCGDCREILALAVPELTFPEKVHEMEVVEGSAVGGWFTWPTLRWGFVAAGIFVVGFGVLQYQKNARMASVAVSKNAVPPIVANETQSQSRPSPALPEAANARDKTTAVSNGAETMDFENKTADKAVPKAPSRLASRALNTRQSTGAASGSVVSGYLAHGPLVNQNQANQLNQGKQSGQQSAVALQGRVNPPYAPVPSEIRDGPAAASASVGPVTVESQPLNGRDMTQLQPLQNQRLDQQSQDSGSAEGKERRKPLDGVAASPTSKVLKSSPQQAEATVGDAMAVANWTISSTGGLQRSFDQGRSWQDVNVNAGRSSGAAVAQVSVSMNLEKESAAAKQDDKAQAKKDEAEKDEADKKKSAPPIVFRAVSANGADVWAGGSSGLLFHSSDSGGHWIPVVPATDDAALTGDIVSLEFADSQHGKVTTTTSETWLTGDGGKTWRKQ